MSRFQLFYSVDAVELHDMDGAKIATAKTRRIRLTRNGNRRDHDQNVRMLQAMADAGNAVIRDAEAA